MPEDYYKKQEKRIERYSNLADKKQAESDQLRDQAHRMADVIPFGQPILVGHYSEGRDRNYRAKIDNKFRKAMETGETAEYYRRRADSAQSNTAISSDAPDAIELLKAKLVSLKDSHAAMIAGNKVIRSKKLTDEQKVTELQKLGLGEFTAREHLKPDSLGEIGFPRYAIANSSANIRNVEERIKLLEKQKNDVSQEYEAGGIRIVDSAEDNRVMIYFPGVPAEEIRKYLKSMGFRWSPSNEVWQAFRTAAWKIPQIIRKLSPAPVMPAYVNPDLIAGAKELV
jgi:hypothetical protein